MKMASISFYANASDTYTIFKCKTELILLPEYMANTNRLLNNIGFKASLSNEGHNKIIVQESQIFAMKAIYT